MTHTRFYKMADAVSLAVIHKKIYPKRSSTPARFNRRIKDIIDLGGYVWVILQGKEIAGYVAVSPMPGLDGVMDLEGFIDPARRRQGLGTVLLRHLLKELKKMGPKIVAITDGSKGAYAYDGKEVFFQRALKIAAVDTTGAGDAFSSGFVAGMIKYKEILKNLLS